MIWYRRQYDLVLSPWNTKFEDMANYERSRGDNANGGVGNDRGVDWSRYGLGNAENRRPSQSGSRGHEELGPEMYQTGTNELFAQEFVSVGAFTKPFFSRIKYNELRKSFTEFRSLVEIKLFYIPASFIWHMGWCFYFLSYQYFWSDSFFEIWLDRRSGRSIECCIDSILYRYNDKKYSYKDYLLFSVILKIISII